MNDCTRVRTRRIVIAAVIAAVTALLLVLGAFSLRAYSAWRHWQNMANLDGKWIMGKTADEIEEKYGPFDIRQNREDDGEGNYIRAGYKTKKERTGFFGTSPDEYYMIYFNAEGKAYLIDEAWYVPGG